MKLGKFYIILIFGSLFFSCASIQDTNINLRLEKMEGYVTSREFEIDRELSRSDKNL